MERRRRQQDFERALKSVAEGLGPFRSVLAIDVPKTVRFIVDHKVPWIGSQYDAGLLAYRELDDALGLTALAGGVLADSRTGRNGWHGIVSLLRQSVYGRLAGYEDVNDADRLGRDPAMRWIVGGKAVERGGASTSQMGRFETELLANNENLAALADLSGMWIDPVHDHDPPRRVVLDMDSSVSPTFGEQESTAYAAGPRWPRR